ncbi:MAG: GNAT family N-acetyltransferase [Vicinamibacterales bacterium]
MSGFQAATSVSLIVASGAAHFADARALFEEYAAQLGVDLCFQGFSAELAVLPEMYAAPTGRLLLAIQDGQTLGCVGVRRLKSDPEACEMKRLYVREAARGTGLGRRLAEASLAAARELGYRRIVLDTLATMTAARALYAQLGFTDRTPYYDNPMPGVAYLERAL